MTTNRGGVWVLLSMALAFATPCAAPAGQGHARRLLTQEECHRLILAVLGDQGINTEDPTLELTDLPYDKDFPDFYAIDTSDADAHGYYHHIAPFYVDGRTGDVWSGVICMGYRSKSVARLQRKIRKRLGITPAKYRKLRRPGPMCLPGQTPETWPPARHHGVGPARRGRGAGGSRAVVAQEGSGGERPGAAGWVLEESSANYNKVCVDYIFFAGRRIASFSPSCCSETVNYYLTDTLGSVRAATDSTGNVCFSADYYPYGQENDYVTTCSPAYRFAGYRLDSNETWQLYYAHARYYAVSASRRSAPGPALPRPPRCLHGYGAVRLL